MKGEFPAASKVSTPLGREPLGYSGHIVAVDPGADHGLPPDEIERRLIELGFVEGMPVEILHQGLIDRDPIAVRLNGSTIALRRREAMAILVK